MDADQELEHQRDLQRLRGLRPIDDDFMRVLFQGQLPLAQEVLRIITGIDDLVLIGEETQHDMKRLAGARSICLDVYGEDSEGRRYDLEVQRSDQGAEPRRARYHGSAMDVESLDAGQGFDGLPEAYVIFITERDLFGKGAGVYSFQRTDTAAGIALEDGSHIIYANGEYRGDDALGLLMHDFMCCDPDDMRIGPLAERARYFKDNPEGVSKMCKVMEEMRDEAMERGMEKGMEKGRLDTLFELVRDGVLPITSAADRAGIAPDLFVSRAAEAGYVIG